MTKLISNNDGERDLDTGTTADPGADNAPPTGTKGVKITSDNVVDELFRVLGEMDSPLAAGLFGILNNYIHWFPNIDKLDSFILLYAANMFLHAAVKEFKRHGFDSEFAREICRVYTIKLFKLDDAAWTPAWLFEPYRKAAEEAAEAERIRKEKEAR